MHLEFLFTLVACFPILAMSLVGVAVLLSSLKELVWKPKHPQKRRFQISARNAAMGLAFLPFGILYQPSLAEVVKTEIRRQEDADEDENGGPDSPKNNLPHQLRRIRRGEQGEILSVRLE